MHRAILIIILYSVVVVHLQGQDTPPADNPEKVFAQMRELAVAGDYNRAKEIGYGLLEDNEAYHDVALYLARIHGWESSFDSAYVLLDRVMEMDPDLYEAYSTCVDLAYWENNLDKLEECAERATELEPDSAAGFDTYRLALKQSAPRSPQPELIAIYSYDHFSKPYVRNWHMLTAGAELPIKNGKLIPYVNTGFLAGSDNSPASDVQFNLDAYLTLGRLNYALLAVGFSPDGKQNYFPGQRAAAEIWQVLPKGFALSAGLRYYYWDQSFTFLTFSAEKYAGNYWFSLRNYLFFKDYGVSGSYYLSIRRYLASSSDYLTLVLGYGTAPDEPIDVVSDLERLNAVSGRLELSKKITPDIRLISQVGYAYEEYDEEAYRHRLDFRIGAYIVIKK